MYHTDRQGRQLNHDQLLGVFGGVDRIIGRQTWTTDVRPRGMGLWDLYRYTRQAQLIIRQETRQQNGGDKWEAIKIAVVSLVSGPAAQHQPQPSHALLLLP